MFKQFWNGCLSLVLAGLLAGYANVAGAASPVLDRVVDEGVLRVGMSGTQPPFNVKSRSGELIGIEVDLARVIAGGLGFELEIVQKPFNELLDELRAGRVDMVMSGMAITPERSQKVSFVGPYLMSGKSILTKSSMLAAVGDAGQMNRTNVTLAALAGSTSEAFAKRSAPEAKLVPVANYDEAVQLLRDGKVDALVADMPICRLTMMRFPEDGFVTLREPFTYEPIGIAVPANDPQFLNLVENFVRALEVTGIMESIRDAWLKNSAWVSELP